MIYFFSALGIWLIVAGIIMVYMGYASEPEDYRDNSYFMDNVFFGFAWPVLLIGLIVITPIIFLFEGLGFIAKHLALFGAWIKRKTKK